MNRAERRHRTFQKQQARINRLRFCHGHEVEDSREAGRLKRTPPGGIPRCPYKGDLAIPMSERRILASETDVVTLKRLDIHQHLRAFISKWFGDEGREGVTEELHELRDAFEYFKVTKHRAPSMRWSYKQQGLWDLLMTYHK